MNWDLLWDVISGVFLVLGAFLSLAAGIGIVRFPNLLARMHAATKPQVLGLVFVLMGLELRLRSGAVLLVLVLVLLFQLLTSPVAAHMVGRAGYRTGKIQRDLLVYDDLSDDIDAAGILEAQEHLTRIAAQLSAVERDASRGDTRVVPHSPASGLAGATGPLGHKLLRPKITGLHEQILKVIGSEPDLPDAAQVTRAVTDRCSLADSPKPQDRSADQD